jgi:uncharacterized protein with FMN-binding domain
MRNAITAVVLAAALTAPAANAANVLKKATPKKKVLTVTKTLSGPQAQASEWGTIQVTLVVKKTTTVVGTKKTVTRKITKVAVPVYPNHTNRSVFINQQALPMLVQETLSAQWNIANIHVVSGATDTSDAFGQSLQAALVAAKNA